MIRKSVLKYCSGLKVLKWTALCVLLLSSYTARSQHTKFNRTGPYHEWFFGVDLLTPLGGIPQSSYRKIGFISTNTCISFHGEYKHGKFSVRTPIRIPINSYGTIAPKISSDDYISRSRYQVYEIGILPTYHFLATSHKLIPYSYLGVHFGSNRGMQQNRFEHYTYNATTMLFTDYNHTTMEYELGEKMNYLRFSFGFGSRLKLNKRLSIDFDASLFVGKIRKYRSILYSNFESSNGALYTKSNRTYKSLVYGTRLGISLTYLLYKY